MDIKVLTQNFLVKKLQELNNNSDEFIKWVADIILLSDKEQLALLESFRSEFITVVEAQKNALEAEKLQKEQEMTQAINALTALDGKVEKKVAPVEEK